MATALLLAAVGAAPAAARYQPPPVDFSLTPAAGTLHAAGGGQVVTAPLRTGKRFNIVGITWRGGARPVVRIRAHVAGGRWSSWQQLGTSADHNPDLGTGEAFARSVSDPAWAGDADAVQLRLSRRVAGLRLHLVNVLGTATAADRARTARHRAALEPAQASPQAPGAPPIVPRSGWNASACGAPRAAPFYGQARIAIVHHTESLNGYSRSQSPSIVLGICRFHRDTRGWNDIGYNFLVDRYGTLFEGRAGGIDGPVRGAHAGGFNDESTGIAVIGNTVSTPATQPAMTAMAALIRWKLPLEGAPTAGATPVTSAGGPDSHWAAGVTVTEKRISGHRDVDSTDCPGGALYGQLPELRRMVGDLAPDPALAPTALSFAPSPTVVRVPGQTLLRGALAGASGMPIPGARIDMKAWRGSSWHTVASVTTDGLGGYSAAYAPQRGDVLDAFYEGDSSHRRSVSPAAGVSAQPALLLVASAPAVASGAPLRLAGAIAPKKGRVSLVIVRRSGRRFVRVSTATVVARGGRFGRTLRLRKGVYRAYARFGGDGLNTPARSPNVSWTVTGA